MQSIQSVPREQLQGKRVLVRAGLDVPLGADGEVADLFRVKQSLETIQYLKDAGARVIILSHIGRDPSQTNAPVARALNTLVRTIYISDITGPAAAQACGVMRDGEIIILENLRSDPGEKGNDQVFAQAIARLGEIYVDDAFSVAHREDASIVSVPKYLPHYAGILMDREVRILSDALTPQTPSLAILGGAKFETKEPLVHKLLDVYDHFLIAGALANDIFKAHGFPIGQSLVSAMVPGPEVLEHPHLLIPKDVTVENKDGQARVVSVLEVADTDAIVDTGPDTVAMLAPIIAEAKTILWNGPTGVYERGYDQYTDQIAELIVHSGARAIIGGGDTVAALQQVTDLASNDRVFLSTGGGAMLEFLMKGTLPGIEALS